MSWMQTYTRGRKGNIRWALEVNQDWLETFDPPMRKKIMRLAAFKTAQRVRQKFFPRRIQASTVTRAPFNYKLGGKTPMIDKGDLLRNVFKGKITARIPQGKDGPLGVSITIPTPFGHPVPPEISRVWKNPQPDEVQWAGNDLARQLLTEKGRLEAKMPRRGRQVPRIRLSAEQKAELRASKQERVRGVNLSEAQRARLNRRRR